MEDYSKILKIAIAEIKNAKNSIARKINKTTISVYWNLGKLLHEKKIAEGYGSKVVKRLSVDLKTEFPDMGFSPRNMWDMKRFYERYQNAPEKLRRSVAVLPWGHNLLIMMKTNSENEALFYTEKTIQMGWTKEILLNYIKADDYQLETGAEKSHNFDLALPNNLSDQACEILKSKYNLGFLGVNESLKELELEKKLIDKIKLFILELGKGFTFIGNQYRLEYNNKEYFIDMLFYHRNLRSLVAIELKIGEFKPEYVGKMNFYLTLLDRLEKNNDENPSIGIILCADKDHLDVEIALQDINKPIGVAEYKLLLPKKQLEEMVLEEIKNAELLENKDRDELIH
ncbi:MAG: PDDEXK nuclease domain-containing protein [Candidatus Marinimicrobia bacterium]|nr:PDDEXK nuclease domain-containing protein [Candidatus Neomarinimicrobiota bacterium]